MSEGEAFEVEVGVRAFESLRSTFGDEDEVWKFADRIRDALAGPARGNHLQQLYFAPMAVRKVLTGLDYQAIRVPGRPVAAIARPYDDEPNHFLITGVESLDSLRARGVTFPADEDPAGQDLVG